MVFLSRHWALSHGQITPSMRSCAMSLVILVVAAGAYVSPAAAQTPVGAITGTVVDPVGGVLPGAAVTVTATGTNDARTTFTDGAGVYVVANLTAGTYRVEVQLQGFNRFARIDAQVQADTVTRVDVTLALGDFAATVAVTAERRTTDVQKTPVPVTVLNGRELEEKGVERMADLEFATPLMTVDNAALTQNVTIRGIGLKSGSPRASSGVAVYRDGVLVPPILNQTSFFDIGSVETLRGPQGTFAGSYSTGGAIYINSRDPDFNGVSGYVDTGAKTYNGYGASGAVNVPFSETLAMRIALDGRTRDSYYDFINGGNGSPAPGGLQELGGRVGLLWQPSSDLRALFKVEGVRREAGGRDHRPRPGGIYAPLAPHDWRTLDFDTAQSTFERTARIALRLDYQVTNGVTLRSVTGGNDNHADNVDDIDGSAGVVPGAAGSEQHQLVSERTWSQELDLISSNDRPFSWVLGAYIFRTRIDVDIDQFTSPTAGRTPTVGIDIQNRKGNQAVFGHGRYNFTPALQAELGVRWSHSFTEDTGAIDVLNVFGPGVNLVLANDGNHSDGVVTGKAGLNWTVNDRNYLFAFAAKGFTPGTANGSGAILSPAFVANPGANPELNQVEPETVISYETGWRSTLANGALRTQMGIFLSDYSNFQITNRNLNTGQPGALVNADSATLYGFEAQAQLAAAGFQADVSVGAMKSRIDNASVVDESPALVPSGPAPMPQCVPATGPAGSAGPAGCWNYALVDVVGNTMSFAPNWTFTAGVQHSFRHRWGLLTPRLNYSFVGEQWTSIHQITAPINNLLGVRSILNGSLTYEQGTWRVRGFVDNLTNQRYVTGTFFENEFYGAPRTAGVELSRRF